MSLPTEITGRETPARDGSALDALIDFYRAFNTSDLEALAANWAEGDAPSMDNPIGGIRRGWPAIKEGYAKLFGGPATVRVAFHDFTAQGNNDYHLFVGRERLLRNSRCSPRASNSHVPMVEDAWRLAAAPSPWVYRRAALLADYQRAIFGAPLGATFKLRLRGSA